MTSSALSAKLLRGGAGPPQGHSIEYKHILTNTSCFLFGCCRWRKASVHISSLVLSFVWQCFFLVLGGSGTCGKAGAVFGCVPPRYFEPQICRARDRWWHWLRHCGSRRYVRGQSRNRLHAQSSRQNCCWGARSVG